MGLIPRTRIRNAVAAIQWDQNVGAGGRSSQKDLHHRDINSEDGRRTVLVTDCYPVMAALDPDEQKFGG